MTNRNDAEIFITLTGPGMSWMLDRRSWWLLSLPCSTEVPFLCNIRSLTHSLTHVSKQTEPAGEWWIFGWLWLGKRKAPNGLKRLIEWFIAWLLECLSKSVTHSSLLWLNNWLTISVTQRTDCFPSFSIASATLNNVFNNWIAHSQIGCFKSTPTHYLNSCRFNGSFVRTSINNWFNEQLRDRRNHIINYLFNWCLEFITK